MIRPTGQSLRGGSDRRLGELERVLHVAQSDLRPVPPGGGSGTRFATRMVASYYASPAVLVEADYVCDLTDNALVIQQALDDVDAVGGGEVWLSEGTFMLESMVTVHEGCSLRGIGWSNPYVYMYPWHTGGFGFQLELQARISDMSIENQSAHGAVALVGVGCRAQRLTISTFGGIANEINVFWPGCFVLDNVLRGRALIAVDGDVCVVARNRVDGFSGDTANASIDLGSSRGSSVVDNIVSAQNRPPIRLTNGARDCLVARNFIDTWGSGQQGIAVYISDDNVITRNVFRRGSGTAVLVGAGSDNNLVYGNDFGGAVLVDSGTGTITNPAGGNRL